MFVFIGILRQISQVTDTKIKYKNNYNKIEKYVQDLGKRRESDKK